MTFKFGHKFDKYSSYYLPYMGDSSIIEDECEVPFLSLSYIGNFILRIRRKIEQGICSEICSTLLLTDKVIILLEV